VLAFLLLGGLAIGTMSPGAQSARSGSDPSVLIRPKFVANWTRGGSRPASIAFLAGAVTDSRFDVTQLLNDAYHLQANEWDSSSPFTIVSNGNTEFRIADSAIENATNGAPGAYPSLYRGCHWGYCTSRSGLPLKASRILRLGTLTTTDHTTVVRRGAWDDAYDIWFNRDRATTNNSTSGLEMMIWLDHFGGIQPAGRVVASNVDIGGSSYDVWYGGPGRDGGTVSYVLTHSVTSISGLDLGPLTAYAISHRYMRRSWWLLDVEAGFETWIGGEGLSVNSFDVCDSAGCGISSNTGTTRS